MCKFNRTSEITKPRNFCYFPNPATNLSRGILALSISQRKERKADLNQKKFFLPFSGKNKQIPSRVTIAAAPHRRQNEDLQGNCPLLPLFKPPGFILLGNHIFCTLISPQRLRSTRKERRTIKMPQNSFFFKKPIKAEGRVLDAFPAANSFLPRFLPPSFHSRGGICNLSPVPVASPLPGPVHSTPPRRDGWCLKCTFPPLEPIPGPRLTPTQRIPWGRVRPLLRIYCASRP